MKTISIANQKGGVGKTTTALELGTCFALAGKRVLLIDLDQQMNLTDYVGASDKTPTIEDVLSGESMLEDAIIHQETFDIIPGSAALSKADKKYTEADDIYMLEELCHILEDADKYDYVIFDNSPARNILLTMAYIASDYVVVPTECDSGAVKGIRAIEADISKLRDGRHPMSHAEILGIILNKYEKTTMHEISKETIEEDIMPTIKGEPKLYLVRKSIKASESKAMKKSVQKYSKYNNIAVDFRTVSKDLLERIEAHE